MSALILHGVVPAGAPFAVEDLFGLGPVIRVEAGDLCFAASPVPPALDLSAVFADPGRAALAALGHHEILCEIATGTDVLPLRLGAAVSGANAARDRLGALAETIRPALRRVGGLVEYRLTARRPALAAAAPTAGYLRARTEARRAGEAALAALDRILDRVAAAAGDAGAVVSVRATRGGTGEIGREATLILDRAARAAFEAEARARAEAEAGEGIAVTVEGPWPPYALSGEETP
jgi:hypothetical protein